MKKIFTLIAAALMSASMFAQPATVPTVTDLADAGYDLTSSRVICLYFDEQVYNGIVWAGSYNGWSTTPVDMMMKFEPLESYDGWYVIELWDDSETVQGNPVQLKNDGSFSWNFQSGDPEAWINMAQPGTQTATISKGDNRIESNCTWPTTGAYIYEVAYFKNHNSPHGEDKPKYDYTITAYLPQFCDAIAAYADSVRVMGDFDDWTDGVWMQKKVDEDYNGCWYAELKDVEEGTEFKLRFGTDADWKVQVQLDGKNLDNMMTGETTDIVLQYDGEGYGFAVCGVPVEFVDATSGLKFEAVAVGEANTVKVMKNDYAGTSYTVPATVSYQSVTFNVTEIGKDAFEECSSLESVTIPASVTTIGQEAFHKCESLQSVTLSENLTTIEEAAFNECPSLASITIPAGVTTIGSGAFGNNTGLTSVTFLGNACQESVGDLAFQNVGSTTPATLVLPANWTGTKPDEDGNWYGGKFELSEDPSALPKVDGTGITVNGRKYGFPVRLVKEVK